MGSPLFFSNILDPKEFAHATGVVFRGLSVNPNKAGYNIVLRAFSKDRQAVYAMTTDIDAVEGLRRLFKAVSMGDGSKVWAKDKFYSSP